MNYYHHLARGVASRKHSSRKGHRGAVKDRTRRALFVERLEDRSLMAADLLSQFYNDSTINLLDAEGEAGSTLPNKVSYTLQILDASGNALTSAGNRTATLRNGTDFYLQLVGQDVRPNGTDPVNGNKLARGIFAAYTDILYDKNFATIAANETQSIGYGSAGQTGTFTLTLPANASGKSGTTGPISFNRVDNIGTANNIKDALNTALFGSTTANGVKVVFGNGKFNVTFLGINNISLPLMTSDNGSLTIAEVLDGAASNTLAAVQSELNAAGQARYGNGLSASEASFGIDDFGGFSTISGLDNTALPVLRIHMIATASTTAQTVIFTPDPINDIKRGSHNTLVYGNENVTVIDPDTGAPVVAELEKSLVQYAPTNNEFLNLTGVTLSISNPVYTAVPDTGFSVNENHTAGVNSVTIPVLANDTFSGFSGTPIKEIKSFDATTIGGTITKVGDNLVFTPNVDFSGTATFTYTGGPVGDNSTAATGTVTVSVAEVNLPPTCNFGPAQNTDDEKGLQTVSGWMTGCTANDPAQTVSFTVTTDKPELFTVVPTIDANGKLSFDPAPNVQGTAKVTVTIKDDGGTANGGVDQTKVELQFSVVKLHQFYNAAGTGPRRGLDVTGSSSTAPDGQILAQDVLAVINYINAKGQGDVPDNAPAGAPYVDVNGNGQVTAEDVIIIINYINAHPGESEGEAQELSGVADQSSAASPDDMLLLLAADVAGQAKRTRRA